MLARLAKRAGALLRKAAQALDEEPNEISTTTAQWAQSTGAGVGGPGFQDAPEHWIQMLRENGMDPVVSHDAASGLPGPSTQWTPAQDGRFGTAASQQFEGYARPGESGGPPAPGPILSSPSIAGGARRWATKSPDGRLRLPRRGSLQEVNESRTLNEPSEQTSDTVHNAQPADVNEHHPLAPASGTGYDSPGGPPSAPPVAGPAGTTPHKRVSAVGGSRGNSRPAIHPDTSSGKGQQLAGMRKKPPDGGKTILGQITDLWNIRGTNDPSQDVNGSETQQPSGNRGAVPPAGGARRQSRTDTQKRSHDAQTPAQASTQDLAHVKMHALIQAQARLESTRQNSVAAKQPPWPELNHPSPVPPSVSAPPIVAAAILERSLARAQRLRAEQAQV